MEPGADMKRTAAEMLTALCAMWLRDRCEIQPLQSVCRAQSLGLQGHDPTYVDRWAHPVRYADLDASFAVLNSKLIPDYVGTVNDTLDQLNAIGLEPLGARDSLLVVTVKHMPIFSLQPVLVAVLAGLPAQSPVT